MQLRKLELKPFIECVDQLVLHDEVERALSLIDNVPAEWRDNMPSELSALRDEILSRIATPCDYAAIEQSMSPYVDDACNMRETLRYMLVAKDVRRLNSGGFVPFISDFGPAEYWLPVILEGDDLKFAYTARHLNQSLYDRSKQWFSESHNALESADQPRIFCALEIIEHMPRPSDLRVEALKCGRLPDIIHISTPKYAYNDGTTDWRARKLLGHLRAYTPSELQVALSGIFPEYASTFYDSQIMHARLTLKDTEFSAIKATECVDILEE